MIWTVKTYIGDGSVSSFLSYWDDYEQALEFAREECEDGFYCEIEQAKPGS